jgi:hypothetical protein
LKGVDRNPELLQYRYGAAFGLPEQRAEQVRGLYLAVPPRSAQRLGLREGFLALDREFVYAHGAELVHRERTDKPRNAFRRVAPGG